MSTEQFYKYFKQQNATPLNKVLYYSITLFMLRRLYKSLQMYTPIETTPQTEKTRCSQVGEHISLGIYVSQVGEHISLGICVSQVGEHISLGIRVSQVGEYISVGIRIPVQGNTYH